MITFYGRLEKIEEGLNGYKTYIFKNINGYELEDEYFMIVRRPNWEHRELQVGEYGYVTFEKIKAGVDTYFKDNQNLFYNFSTNQFIKFLSNKKGVDEEFTL